jgi:two-component system, LytTR family, sensor kinase
MYQPLTSRTWHTTSVKRIKVVTMFSNIRIATHDADDIRVELMGKAYRWLFWANSGKSHTQFKEYDIELDQENDLLNISIRYKGGITNWFRLMAMKMVILVPQNSTISVDCTTDSGNIEAENYTGKLHLYTGAGTIRLHKIDADIECKTGAGVVDIRQCKGTINAHSSAGAMEVEHCDGSININTAAGSIEMSHLIGQVNANTAAGSIEAFDIDGSLYLTTAAGSIAIKSMKGSLIATTYLGSVSAEVLALGASVHLTAHAGSVDLQMPFDQGINLLASGMSVSMSKTAIFEGIKERSRIEGRMQDGGIPVELKATVGTVKIRSLQHNAFDSIEKTFKDHTFTLPTHFFNPSIKGIFLSFAFCVLMTFGVNSIIFFISEQIQNIEMRPAYIGIFIGNLISSALALWCVFLFTRHQEHKIKSNARKYWLLALSAYTMAYIGQIILYVLYWQFVEVLGDADVSERQPLFLYGLIPPLVACVYFFFLQRSRQITRKISEQEFQLVNLEQLKTSAQLDALQARINPHFLYNALNSIAGLVHEDADKAEKMTLLLSKLFRSTIGTKDQHYNTLENELEIVRTYLDIEQVRFGDRLQYSIEVDETLLSKEIPRFLLQPIVENAIKHGISKMTQKGQIVIKIVKKEDKIWCSIHDNGPAFTPNFFSGYGLQSIQDKLNLLYGNNAALDIQNDIYKQVTIQLPC